MRRDLYSGSFFFQTELLSKIGSFYYLLDTTQKSERRPITLMMMKWLTPATGWAAQLPFDFTVSKSPPDTVRSNSSTCKNPFFLNLKKTCSAHSWWFISSAPTHFALNNRKEDATSLFYSLTDYLPQECLLQQLRDKGKVTKVILLRH